MRHLKRGVDLFGPADRLPDEALGPCSRSLRKPFGIFKRIALGAKAELILQLVKQFMGRRRSLDPWQRDPEERIELEWTFGRRREAIVLSEAVKPDVDLA